MGKTTVFFVCFFFSMASFAQDLTSDEKDLLATYEREYSVDQKKVTTHFAWLLYRSGEGTNARADSILNQAIALQDHDPESLAYGQWGWSLKNGEKSADGNNALFQTHIMFCSLWEEQQKMSADTKRNFISSCEQIVEAAKRRWDYEIFDIYRDHTSYSNPFVMCIQTFTLAADRFNSSRLKKLAKGQWARWYNHISFFGIDEFASPVYNPVSGYTDQIGTSALCVYNRLPNYWHLTQKRGEFDSLNYKETFDNFGIGFNSWKEKSKTADRIVLGAYGYELHLFPFSIRDEKLAPCGLELKHRTTTSPRYHPRPRIFDEYIFPAEPDWFGVHVILAKAGTKVDKPRIEFSNGDGIRTFKTDKGHQLRLFVAAKGDTRQLYNVDPALIPLFKIIE